MSGTTETQSKSAEYNRLPRWPAIGGLTLSFLGFGIAAYLTYEHYTASTSLTCPAAGGMVNCLKVTTSGYSEISGVPVAVLGLIFFAVMSVLQSPRAWNSHWPALRVGRVVWSLVGVGTAVWLIYAELFKLDAICEWCTAVHAVSVLLFGLTVFGTAVTAEEPEPEPA
ncbi:MAG TPA: vitamin K epoxide reductase family protein [Acidimicrobiales bacterium]|nr:vitamin K epoxide reductase family protein [Acidimicrobiales bacterium]